MVENTIGTTIILIRRINPSPTSRSAIPKSGKKWPINAPMAKAIKIWNAINFFKRIPFYLRISYVIREAGGNHLPLRHKFVTLLTVRKEGLLYIM